MNDGDKFLDINFSYTDEFGQLSNLHKTFDPCVLDDSGTFDILVEQFKLFLVDVGFPQETVDKIEIKDN